MPRTPKDPRHPLVVGTDNGESVLVRFIAHDHNRTNMRVGDEAWVAGDGVDALVAEGFAVYVVADDGRQPQLVPGQVVVAALPAEVAAAVPKRKTKVRKAVA